MGITNAMINSEKNVAPLVLGMSRHKSYQTTLNYQKPNDEIYKNYNKAILGKHVPSPPTTCRSKKTKINDSNDNVLDNIANQVPSASDHVSVTTACGGAAYGNTMDRSVTVSECSASRHSMDCSSEIVTSGIGGTAHANAMDRSLTVSKSAASRHLMSHSSESVEGRQVALSWNGVREVNESMEGSVTSAGASSLSTLVSSMASETNPGDLTLVPIRGPSVNAMNSIPYYTFEGNPVFNTLHSNTVQRNYILPQSTMSFALETELAQYKEENVSMEHRVKELELRLAHQTERYENIKEDLREVRKEGSKGDNKLWWGIV
jgi:hypothetical protein